MILLSRAETRPAFNIAAEEFLLKHFNDDCFTLWRNEPAIIVGRHQNTLAEIDPDFIEKTGIPVLRRLSGGGAVFHDLGNLCFTFVKNKKEGEITDFSTFSEPIVAYLQSLGVKAEFTGRNDLTIDGLKFSGNAEASWKGRVLHHGTLLFSSQLSDWAPALKADPEKFKDKAVKSVRSRITNIADHLPHSLSLEAFTQGLEDFVAQRFPQAQYRSLSSDEKKGIEKLVDEKYSRWEWNYGHSPKYNTQKKVRSQAGGSIASFLMVEDGRITAAEFRGDFFADKDPEILAQRLCGQAHEKNQLRQFLEQEKAALYFKNTQLDEILEALI